MKIFFLLFFNIQLFAKVGLVTIPLSNNVNGDSGILELILTSIIIYNLIIYKRWINFFKGFKKGLENFREEMKEVPVGYSVPSPEEQTARVKLDLAKKYCWGDYPYKRDENEAKRLLSEVIQNGTDDEVRDALEYLKSDCESMYNTLFNLAIALGRIKTGTDIL